MGVTVVGGGLTGLFAAIECAERGARVRLLECRGELGGYARSADGAFRPNYGPHALYSDGPLWRWLRERRLLPPVTASPLTKPLAFHVGGRARLAPPLDMVRALALHRRLEAPVERDFRSWASERFGERTAERLAGALGVVTFHHDPGSLSAAFVWERAVRVTALPPITRYPAGGWTAIVERLAERARELGVEVETGARAGDLPDAPVIVATGLADARELLGDDSLAWPGTRSVLLDVALRARRLDPQVVSDLDGAAFVEDFGVVARGMAPPGRSLLQAHLGLRPGEDAAAGAARIEAVLDAAFPRWREREVWRRRMVSDERTGAVDPPGATWRDRPAIDRGDGVFVATDRSRAPGLLAEVGLAAAIEAARGAVAAAAAAPRRAAA
jgi:glycine/D-amino acid oxidase-like deaminating enzyme